MPSVRKVRCELVEPETAGHLNSSNALGAGIEGIERKYGGLPVTSSPEFTTTYKFAIL